MKRSRQLLVALLVVGCSDPAKQAEAAVVVAASPSAPQPTAAADPALPIGPDPRAQVLDAPPRVGRGLRRSPGGPPLPALVVAGVGERFDVGQSPVTIDLEDGTRVTIAPGAQVWASFLSKTLLLVSGELHATRVADAQHAGQPPVRMASLAGVLEPNPGAELALRVDVRATAAALAYRAQLDLARGSLTWTAPEEHAARRQAPLIVGEPFPRPPPGWQWLSLPAGHKARSERDKRFAALRPVGVSADLDALLDAALTEQQALRRHGHALLAQVSPRHAALAQPGEAAVVPESSVRAYQRELVAHAQRRDAQAMQLLSAAERSLLRALALCGDSEPHECASLRAWSERFSARAADLL